MTLRAVLFDLGGVVLGSPFRGFLEYDAEAGLALGTVLRLIGAGGSAGAWERLERGELDMESFYAAFDAEAAAAGVRISSAALMDRIAETTPILEPMVDAVRRLRGHGLRAGALTNNWLSGDQQGKMAQLRGEFDAFVESARVGMRKPDPRIYALACESLGVPPAEVVFLDDIGQNLKPARAMGMTTIKVQDPLTALGELEQLLGVSLR
jgi:putative hydrolase of the HAD superfamily